MLKRLHVNDKMNQDGRSMVLEIFKSRDLNYWKDVLEMVKLNSDIILFVPLISRLSHLLFLAFYRKNCDEY